MNHAHRGSWPSPVKRKLKEARHQSQASLHWSPCCSREGENKPQAPLLPRGVQGKLVPTLLPLWGWGDVSRVRAEAVAQVVCKPFGGAVCRGQAQYPAFVPAPCFAVGSLDVAVYWWWFFFFLVFLRLVHNLSQLCMHTVIFVTYRFLIFCSLRKHLFRCRHCSKGSQVPACLTCRGSVCKGRGAVLHCYPLGCG